MSKSSPAINRHTHGDAAACACEYRVAEAPHRREIGVLLVVALTFVMMVVEISVGYVTHSMALLADGWHMATHVGALGITVVAYVVARRFAMHRAFSFGTGKVHALAGFSSSLLLAGVALAMFVQSAYRFYKPDSIDFAHSLPVAFAGLIVNLVSVALLRHHDEPGHEQEVTSPDHGHRAAFLHVIADALTSGLAIIALLLGQQWGWVWLDPITGMLGGVIILKWSVDLTRTTASELLDLTIGESVEARIRALLSRFSEVTVLDLHVWPMGRGQLNCILVIVSDGARRVEAYREAILSEVPLSHLAIELRSMRKSE
ncbi:MAG TPA: CDF family Co(II)/Ni(II) efflux transporter DmeF [Polyangiaceae bacterium]